MAYGRREDVVGIITRTIKCVANNYFLLDEEESRLVQKQMPVFISTLRRKFYLTMSKERNLALYFIQKHNEVVKTVNELKEKVDILYENYEHENKYSGRRSLKSKVVLMEV